MRIIRKFIGLGLKMSMFVVALPFICFICFGITIGIAKSAISNGNSYSGENNAEDAAKLLFANNPSLIKQTQGYHVDQVSSGAGGGYDYTTYCGDMLYSPVFGTATVTYKGLDGIYANNTMITISGKAGTATLLHGNYNLVEVGDTVVGGITPIGTNASNGYSTGCHAHLNWKPANQYIAVGEPLKRSDIQHTGKRGNYGSVLSDYSNVYLRISHYTPIVNGVYLSGTVNCDSDCSTMASGDKVEHWTFGRNGVYAAACPQEWAFSTRFSIQGNVYECRDRGGYINCYDYGDYDPALKRPAEGQYCWVDLLNDSQGFAYGQEAYEWDFVK